MTVSKSTLGRMLSHFMRPNDSFRLLKIVIASNP